MIFAGCVIAIPVSSWLVKLGRAALCAIAVAGEMRVLAFNQWRCSLAGMASRRTGDRRDKIDIYLREWLARHNNVVFSLLGVGRLIVLLWGYARQ